MPFTVAVVYFSRHGRLVTLANVVAEGARSVPGADVEVYRVPDPLVEGAAAVAARAMTVSPRETTDEGGGDDEGARSPPPPPPHSSLYEDGVLDAPVATRETLAAADVILLGAPARHGGMCGEMRMFLDSLVGPATSAAAANDKDEAAAAARSKAASSEAEAGEKEPSTPTAPLPPRQETTASPPPPSHHLDHSRSVSLRGKVGAAFTAIGGPSRGHGGAESVLGSFHATFLSHGMVVVGCPPSALMDSCLGATPLGAVAAGGGGALGNKRADEEDARRKSASELSPSWSSEVAAAAARRASPLLGNGSGASGGGSSVTLSGAEVRLGYSLGQWAAQVGALLHGDDDDGGCEHE